MKQELEKIDDIDIILGNNEKNNIVEYVEKYKEKREKSLESLARRIAREVATTKVEAKLDSMNSYERRFVHTIISEYPELETESIGEGLERHITIKYKEI